MYGKDREMGSPGAIISRLKIFARRVQYLRRWLAFIAFGRGRSAGPLALNRGIIFSPGMRLRLGSNVWLGAYGVFQGTGEVFVGERTYVGHHFFIGAVGKIDIGADCMLANFVSIVDSNHGLDPSKPFAQQPLNVKPIVIEDNCWIAEKATILAGTRIGKGSVVAAGAVVRKDVPPGTIVGGIPARAIRQI